MTCPPEQPWGSPVAIPAPAAALAPRGAPAIAAYPHRRGFCSPLLSPRLSPALSCSVKVKLGCREPPLPTQPLPWHGAAAAGSGPHHGCCRLPGTSYASLTMKKPRGFSHRAGLFLWVRFLPVPSPERSLRSGGGAQWHLPCCRWGVLQPAPCDSPKTPGKQPCERQSRCPPCP